MAFLFAQRHCCSPAIYHRLQKFTKDFIIDWTSHQCYSHKKPPTKLRRVLSTLSNSSSFSLPLTISFNSFLLFSTLLNPYSTLFKPFQSFSILLNPSQSSSILLNPLQFFSILFNPSQSSPILLNLLQSFSILFNSSQSSSILLNLP